MYNKKSEDEERQELFENIKQAKKCIEIAEDYMKFQDKEIELASKVLETRKKTYAEVRRYCNMSKYEAENILAEAIEAYKEYQNYLYPERLKDLYRNIKKLNDSLSIAYEYITDEEYATADDVNGVLYELRHKIEAKNGKLYKLSYYIHNPFVQFYYVENKLRELHEDIRAL